MPKSTSLVRCTYKAAGSEQSEEESKRVPDVEWAVNGTNGSPYHQWCGQVHNFKGRPARNTQRLPLPLEGGGWEGVSRNGITEDVFHAVPLWRPNSVRTIDHRPARVHLREMVGSGVGGGARPCYPAVHD
ncbi:hypothetical protein GCM10008959_37400 [Deinococcus seoulensis]|uniref:Uncharacterized protein n=1 Tax=Deinococcus seoulensis TaxID=1837379 RepID=A0ABQ2S0A1_9DEIO|nr:hypothetical protein GCM10008959_37400 [Deinococcus seoulensis]